MRLDTINTSTFTHHFTLCAQERVGALGHLLHLFRVLYVGVYAALDVAEHFFAVLRPVLRACEGDLQSALVIRQRLVDFARLQINVCERGEALQLASKSVECLPRFALSTTSIVCSRCKIFLSSTKRLLDVCLL